MLDAFLNIIWAHNKLKDKISSVAKQLDECLISFYSEYQ